MVRVRDSRMVEIHIVNDNRYLPILREIFGEYLRWGNGRVEQEYGVSLDIEAMLDNDIQDLSKFMPPSGRLLLGIINNHPAGVACLKYLDGQCGEIKRMYVRPDARKAGLGKALLERLITEAVQIGYQRLRLDSARFMVDAHRLYHKAGFEEIEPYEGSEVPVDFQKHWVFMQKDLSIPASSLQLQT